MEGKYQAYPEYKSSGVEWLGKIPSHWETWKLKHSLNSALLYGANEAALDENKNDPRYIRITDMNEDGSLRSDTFKSLPMSVASSYLLEDGDILLARSGATVGKSFFYQSKLGVSCFAGYLIKASINNEILNSRYAHWFFQSDQYWKYISGSQIQSTIQNVSAEKYGEMKLPFSRSLAEQQKIANFLDHETAKIDTLIEKQQQLIKLLKEKRQAVISYAVTKGLNPDVPMRDSGVEWLGEVPEHWEVAPLKYLVSAPIIDGPHLTPEKYDMGIPFISAEAVSQGYINFEKKWGYISEEDHKVFSKRYCPQRGDILVVKLGATTGVAAIVETDEPFNVWVPLATVRTKKGIPSKYIFYLLHSAHVKDAIQLSWTFGTQQTLGLGTLGNLSFPVPVEQEMINIIDFIESKIPMFDKLVSKAKESLSLLQERRTAIISAAVTGKIDVRNWSAPNA